MVSKELRDQAISWFKNKYPKANIDKFEFGYNLNDDGTLKTMCTIRLYQNTKTGF